MYITHKNSKSNENSKLPTLDAQTDSIKLIRVNSHL